MFIGPKDDIRLCIDINEIVVQITGSVKLLGAEIDSMLTSMSIQSAKKLQLRSELFYNSYKP